MAISKKASSRFIAAIADQIPLNLTPSHGIAVARDKTEFDFEIFTEPPNAPGIKSVLRILRQKRKADRAEPDSLSAIFKSGRHLRDEGWVGVFIDKQSAIQVLRYRLVLADREVPFGYCTFTVTIRRNRTFAVDIEEVWMVAVHRGSGVRAGLIEHICRIVRHTLSYLDRALFNRNVRRWPLSLVVRGQVLADAGAALFKELRDQLMCQVGQSVLPGIGPLVVITIQGVAVECD
jgi:hypothetical protein